jgi:hypothetical protein
MGGYEMGLDIWFKDDIKNILLGVEFANAHLAARYGDAEVRAYREGFTAALTATAVSFGIWPGEIQAGHVRVEPKMALQPPVRIRQQ